MTDYSKPVGWWCPECGHTEPERWTQTLCGETDRPTTAIPIYLPLPTPEPTTWGESGGDDAVCNVLAMDGTTNLMLGFESGPDDMHYAHVDDTDRECFISIDTADGSSPLEDDDWCGAIRHVAEE